MALQDISLPVDVPWTLIATSNDMLASHANRFPHAMWRNSLAVFKYDPDPADLPDVEEYKDRALTFLKVVVSITSYTPDCAVCPPPVHSTTEDYGNWQAEDNAWNAKCQEVTHQSYPCAGALLQVAIYPKGQDTSDVTELAYFAAFEPKKRELIEVATESGESATQSKSDLNVRKGVTSTQSTEDLDVFTGMNVSAGAGGASGGFGISGQWGTIKKSGTQQEDVTNTDSSRDLRETSSHTTSLSQLYHLLNSYHLGTNRAIFFVQSRPHTLQQKDQFTFINGPQEIEGVQEFFLVVNRPIGNTIDEYCVDALLYTGHLDIVAMQNAINEPKTAETDWIELWAMKPPLPGDTSVWNPQHWIDKAEALEGDVVDMLESAVGLKADGSLPDGVKFVDPATIDCYVTPAALSQTGNSSSNALSPTLIPPMPTETGWRVDRTRGLGGYDLWEDPNNRSGDFRGEQDDSTAKPQAFVDVVSVGSPDELDNYQPDYALRLRASAWPWGGEQATYHCRFKGYFIRNDLPTLQRSVNMFVTARGVSTCADSPFYDLEPQNAEIVSVGGSPDIVADAIINPPNIAPWAPLSPGAKPIPASQPPTNESSSNAKTATSPDPILFSGPSGLNHPAVGAARAKMANSVSRLVRTQLVSSLACLPIDRRPTRYRFVQSDLYFQTMLRSQMTIELGNLSRMKNPTLGLNKAVVVHSNAAAILGANSPTLNAIRSVFDVSSKPARKAPSRTSRAQSAKRSPAKQTKQLLDDTKVEVQPSNKFPLLTFHESRLDPSIRARFAKAGILSGLDLVGASASLVARRSGIDVNDIREIRLGLLGFPKPNAAQNDE